MSFNLMPPPPPPPEEPHTIVTTDAEFEKETRRRFKKIESHLEGVDGQLDELIQKENALEKGLQAQRRQKQVQVTDEDARSSEEKITMATITSLLAKLTGQVEESVSEMRDQLTEEFTRLVKPVSALQEQMKPLERSVARLFDLQGESSADIGRLRSEMQTGIENVKRMATLEIGKFCQKLQVEVGDMRTKFEDEAEAKAKDTLELRGGQVMLAGEIKRLEAQFTSISTNCLACGAKSRPTEPATVKEEKNRAQRCRRASQILFDTRVGA